MSLLKAEKGAGNLRGMLQALRPQALIKEIFVPAIKSFEAYGELNQSKSTTKTQTHDILKTRLMLVVREKEMFILLYA